MGSGLAWPGCYLHQFDLLDLRGHGEHEGRKWTEGEKDNKTSRQTNYSLIDMKIKLCKKVFYKHLLIAMNMSSQVIINILEVQFNRSTLRRNVCTFIYGLS